MVLRALFWIAVVAVLMPREPDLGFGRPDIGSASSDSMLSTVSSALKAPKACDGTEAACMAALGLLDRLRGAAVESLAQVKADIEEAQRERAARGEAP
jgi:hypothetical protein